MTDKTFTTTQLYALAVFLATKAEGQRKVASEHTTAKSYKAAAHHFGEAQAYQEMAALVRDLSNGCVVKSITGATDKATLARLTASGQLI